jgi:hypothetical protein
VPIDKCARVGLIVGVVLYDPARSDGFENLLLVDETKFLVSHFVSSVKGVQNTASYETGS